MSVAVIGIGHASRKATQVFAKEQLGFHRRVARHIDPRRFFGWFLGLALPFTIGESLFIAWHNSVVDQVGPTHLAIRAAIGVIGYLVIMLIVYLQAIRPALHKAQSEMLDAGQSEDCPGPLGRDLPTSRAWRPVFAICFVVTAIWLVGVVIMFVFAIWALFMADPAILAPEPLNRDSAFSDKVYAVGLLVISFCIGAAFLLLVWRRWRRCAADGDDSGQSADEHEKD